MTRTVTDWNFARNVTDWNFARIYTAQVLITDCQIDMMLCLQKGEVEDVARKRMCQLLRSAADDLERLILCHGDDE